MRVFVTGAGGFVGGHLCARLEDEGCAVVATDREVDVTDRAAVTVALRRARPDAVVHLAAWSSVADSFEDPRAVWRVNVEGTRAVLEAVEEAAPAARVLLVTSGQIYGPLAPGAPPHREDAPLRPASPYAETKAEADRLGAAFAARGLSVVRARPFNHTGPGQSDRFAAASFARQLAEIEAGLAPPRLRVGNLRAERDLLDVADVVDAYWRVLQPAVPADAYNVARGETVSMQAVLDALLAHARVEPEIEVDPALVREADRYAGDATRLRERSGWRPQVALPEIARRLMDDWRTRVRAQR